MNFKPGDLAYIVNSKNHPATNGMLVEIVSAKDANRWYVKGHAVYEYMRLRGASPPVTAAASCLRPIRDNDGEDEMLRIVGKPMEKEQHVKV